LPGDVRQPVRKEGFLQQRLLHELSARAPWTIEQAIRQTRRAAPCLRSRRPSSNCLGLPVPGVAAGVCSYGTARPRSGVMASSSPRNTCPCPPRLSGPRRMDPGGRMRRLSPPSALSFRRVPPASLSTGDADTVGAWCTAPRTAPGGTPLSFDAQPGNDTLLIVVFHLAHLGHQVSPVDEDLRRAAAREYHFHLLRLVIQQVKNLFCGQ